MAQSPTGLIMFWLTSEGEVGEATWKGWDIWDSYVREHMGVPIEEKIGQVYKKQFLHELDSLVAAGYLRRVQPTDLKKGERPTKARCLYGLTSAGADWWEREGVDKHLSAEPTKPGGRVVDWIGKAVHKLKPAPVEVQRALDKHVRSGRLGVVYYDPRKGEPILKYRKFVAAEDLFDASNEEDRR